MPDNIIVNRNKDAKVPSPPPGHKWKEVRHDNKVTWLVSWTENIQGSIKYIMLNPVPESRAEIRDCSVAEEVCEQGPKSVLGRREAQRDER